MSQLEHALAEIVTTVWDSVLGLAVVQDDGFQVSGAHPEHTFAGVVQIQGAWDGAVAVQCSDHLARQAAMTMFNMTESEVSISDLPDALGELTNMTGGHIKALMPEPCTLGLPVVVEGADYRFRLPGSAPMRRSSFRVGGDVVVVTVLERA